MAVSAELEERIKLAVSQRFCAYFRCDSLDITFQMLVLGLGKRGIILENTVPKEMISSVVGAKEFYMQIVMDRFHCQEIQSDGKNVIFPMEETSEAEEVRGQRREPVEQLGVRAEFVNPFDHVTSHVKLVLDLSSTGMSIQNPLDSQLISPGTRIDQVRVVQDGCDQTVRDCEVVYKRKILRRDGKLVTQAGLKFLE